MFTKDLFETVLIDPVKDGSDRLFVVSGYGTVAMAFHHLQEVLKVSKKIAVELIVGMCPQDGISSVNHEAFRKLVGFDYPTRFDCRYLVSAPPVHSKVYSWQRGGRPSVAFLGSANYTQNAFGVATRGTGVRAQWEALDHCDAHQATAYFMEVLRRTIECRDPRAADLVALHRTRIKASRKGVKGETEPRAPVEDLASMERVLISFLDRNGTLPRRSGLNWGQRPELRREPNQAYIRLDSSVYSSGFFPPRGMHFSLMTDDGQVIICTRAQDNGKAIHTPHDNSIIGKYFRKRLGLRDGATVAKSDLERYGRTDVAFYKVDDETFFMDFSSG
ncbi:MAG: NgoFVII family restriction endonuclease [Deltaproteobacteria bacterium]|nr:NgoFVII family restriction endonuclease [Deltaproteobacteria bacterium]